MPRWTKENLKAYEQRRNNKADRVVQSPKPECSFRDEPLGSAPGKESHPTRFKVSIISYRKRLIDPDNLCPKYFIDALRYEGIITDDTAKHIVLEVRQEKTSSKYGEKTVIEITPI